MGFTELLKAHRARMNLTQRKVAEALNVSQTAVYLWETGRVKPSMENVVRLELMFQTNKGELLIPLAYDLSAEQGVNS